MSDNTKRGIVFTLLLVVILFSLGLRVDHPKSGLRNAIGSASSSVAIYWHHAQLTPGEKIIVMTDTPGIDPVLALVNTVNGDTVDIQTMEGLKRVPIKNVRGSLVMVFPFIGMLLGAFGL